MVDESLWEDIEMRHVRDKFTELVALNNKAISVLVELREIVGEDKKTIIEEVIAEWKKLTEKSK